jgi:hypothetical protein
MRSTQFDEHFPFGEEPEEHRGQNQPDTLCETIKRLGYSKNSQVKLHGDVFDLVSDPVRRRKFRVCRRTGPEIRSSQARPYSTDHRADGKNKTSRSIGEQSNPAPWEPCSGT